MEGVYELYNVYRIYCTAIVSSMSDVHEVPSSKTHTYIHTHETCTLNGEFQKHSANN